MYKLPLNIETASRANMEKLRKMQEIPSLNLLFGILNIYKI